MKKPSKKFLDSLTKLDRYIYHTLPPVIRSLNNNFHQDPHAGSYYFDGVTTGKDKVNMTVYGSPFWEDSKGIQFTVEIDDGDPRGDYKHMKTLKFPESELTYDVIIDSVRYLKVMMEECKRLGYDIQNRR